MGCFHKKKSNKDTITWSEAVTEALCFGWIDSKKISVDNDTSHQFFCKRKPKSTWSKINKDKVEQLIAENLMSEAGYQSILVAKANGSWNVLDEVENLQLPKDLEIALDVQPKAREYYDGLNKSSKKMLLHWLLFAKTEATRNKRLKEIVENACNGLKPNHMR